MRGGHNIIVLSDRLIGPDHIAIPSLLAVAAVHHHLIRGGLRTEVGLVVETGEARQLHDFCLLAGFGAEAINPYLAFNTLSSLRHEFDKDLTEADAHEAYIKAISKGIIKVMSKMGICTFQSYCGAQIFDAIGLNAEFLDKYFTGTVSAIGGVGLDEIADETVRRHRLAYGDAPNYRDALDAGGELAFRIHGETHAWNARHRVAAAARGARQQLSQVQGIHAHRRRAGRSADLAARLARFRLSRPNRCRLSEVEPAREIVKRFATGAMSFGSISWEAHTTLAIAMNRLGGRSNTGEGGEDPQRYKPMPNGDSMRSAIKQVASGRFGVNIEYLVNATDLQIKMAQGAKPGEGGQLPGHKVDDWIARTRYSVPGVGLISPPPHHDIYSIEDLAQLIHDLKNANREARVSVKLVAELGVGTIAAGVCKAYADHVTISGHEGGTGASPLTSIHHAGEPWEVGLAETHQTLVLNGLRGRIAVQVDGGIRSGRDVVIGALLGADEFGVATAALIAAGCVMMRKCHLNTCPVGVATQDPELRRRFDGTPDDVVTFFMFLAEEVREYMAKLGFRTFNEMIGRTDRLRQRQDVDHPKARQIDLVARALPARCSGRDEDCISARRRITGSSARSITSSSPAASSRSRRARRSRSICRSATSIAPSARCSRARSPSAMAIAAWPTARSACASPARRGRASARSSRAASPSSSKARATTMSARASPAADLIIYPPKDSKLERDKSIIVGNTVLYGAIAGECYFSGVAGERFAVRNSGAVAVVEGAGAHCCEYMTGGIVVVLGETGTNFAAGMSGGVAFVLDENGKFAAALQPRHGRSRAARGRGRADRGAWSIAAAISRRTVSSTSCTA